MEHRLTHNLSNTETDKLKGARIHITLDDEANQCLLQQINLSSSRPRPSQRIMQNLLQPTAREVCKLASPEQKTNLLAKLKNGIIRLFKA